MNPVITKLAFTAFLAAWDTFEKVREQARRDRIMTDEEDKEHDRQIQERMEQSHWKKSTDA